ncbi:Heterodimeric geranylgeranyl pyrophosphate synthase small subunit, chloroplastic [Linum perenne]
MLTLLPLSSRSSPPVARIRLRLPIRCSISSSYSLSTELKFDLQAYWASLRKEINQKLDEAIPIRYPERIYEAMRYSALSQGAKRAPPVMCVAACELFGLDRLAAFPTACALEMLSLFGFLFLRSTIQPPPPPIHLRSTSCSSSPPVHPPSSLLLLVFFAAEQIRDKSDLTADGGSARAKQLTRRS